jgi:hypothetical protein
MVPDPISESSVPDPTIGDSNGVASVAEARVPGSTADEWTRRRFAGLVATCIGLGTLLRIEAIGTPWALDDFMQIGMSAGVFWSPRAIWDRYRFVSGDPAETSRLVATGALPWWTEPHLKLAMARPIASVAGALELAVIGPNAAVAHALSLFWCAAAVLAVGLVYRRLLPWRTAVIALPIYVLGRSHDIPVGWVANRAAIFATLFGALAVHGHVRWRESGSRWGLLEAVLCLAASAASAEYGIATFGLLVAYELVLSRRGRMVALLPAIAVGLGYAVAYHALGFGTRGTSLYADPINEPRRFVMTALTNVPLLAGEALWPSPLRGVWKVIGVTAILVAIAALFPVLSSKARRSVAGAMFAGLLASIPLTSAAVPNPRLLEIPDIAFVGALAILFEATAETKGRVRMVAVRFVASAHLFLAPLVAWLEMHFTRTMSNFLTFEATSAPLSPDTEDVILVAAAEVFSLHDPPMARHLAGLSMPRAWWVLSVADCAHRLRRVGTDTLELEVLGDGLFDSSNRAAYEPPKPPLVVGSTVDAGRMQATVLAVGPSGPTRVRFHFAEELDDRRVALLTSGPEGYRRLPVPAVGQSVVLPGVTLPPVVAQSLRY